MHISKPETTLNLVVAVGRSSDSIWAADQEFHSTIFGACRLFAVMEQA